MLIFSYNKFEICKDYIDFVKMGVAIINDVLSHRIFGVILMALFDVVDDTVNKIQYNKYKKIFK